MVMKHAKPGHKVSDRMQEQREAAEAAAKAKALKAFSPAEPEEEPAPVKEQSEPSLEQRLADIDRRSRERANEEKRALANYYVTEARHRFRRALTNTTDDAVRSAYEDLNRLERLAGDSGPSNNGSNGNAAPEKEGTGRRERRSSEALKADAQKLVDYLRSNPNSKASSAIQSTGVIVKPPLNLRTYVEKYLPGVKITTEGQRASTVYSVV